MTFVFEKFNYIYNYIQKNNIGCMVAVALNQFGNDIVLYYLGGRIFVIKKIDYNDIFRMLFIVVIL